MGPSAALDVGVAASLGRLIFLTCEMRLIKPSSPLQFECPWGPGSQRQL